MSTNAYIGTSGWNYPHWKTRFYKNTPKSKWLLYYASQFNSLEINSTFYRLQSQTTFQRWRNETPDNFRMSIKANRYLTHNKRLKNADDSIMLEKSHASALEPKLAVVLWQLPANFGINADRLNQFVNALKHWDTVRHAMEFRHDSWFNDTTAELLTQNSIAVCQSDAGDWPCWQQVTTDFVYIRLHGKPRTYASNYSIATLNKWASQIRLWLKQQRDVYVYFDNDADTRAPFNALTLRNLLSN